MEQIDKLTPVASEKLRQSLKADLSRLPPLDSRELIAIQAYHLGSLRETAIAAKGSHVPVESNAIDFRYDWIRGRAD